MADDTELAVRPVLRWHGGKWRLAPWIIQNLPKHRIYVEPYAGAASVLMRKPRAYAEILNDLDGDVVTLFRVLRDPSESVELLRLLRLTPFARAEFEMAYERCDDPVERARRLICRSFMGFGSNAHACEGKGHNSTGFRCHSNRSGTTPAHDWGNYPASLRAICARLRGVVIECRHARLCMTQHDSVDTLHYVDPPYLPETRSGHGRYSHEMTDEDHVGLLAFLGTLRGMVVLSGYPCALYDEALTGWARVERAAYADGARERREVLWLNPAACAALDADLFMARMGRAHRDGPHA